MRSLGCATPGSCYMRIARLGTHSISDRFTLCRISFVTTRIRPAASSNLASSCKLACSELAVLQTRNFVNGFEIKEGSKDADSQVTNSVYDHRRKPLREQLLCLLFAANELCSHHRIVSLVLPISNCKADRRS